MRIRWAGRGLAPEIPALVTGRETLLNDLHAQLRFEVSKTGVQRAPKFVANEQSRQNIGRQRKTHGKAMIGPPSRFPTKPDRVVVMAKYAKEVPSQKLVSLNGRGKKRTSSG